MKYLFLEMIFADKVISTKFSKYAIFVSRLYSRLISEIKIVDLRKITIEIIDDPKRNHVIPTHKLTKVCLISKYFDLTQLNSLDDQREIHQLLLEFIFQSILEFAEKFDWPLSQFKLAYDKVIELDFKNEFVLISNKYSKDRKYSASIIVNSLQEHISIRIEIEGKKSKKIELIKIVYYFDDFSNIIYKLKWINSDEIIVSNKDEEINFIVFIDKEISEIYLTPKIHDEVFLKDEIKRINPNTSIKERIDITNKRLSIN